jgi:hypothetical protein
VRERERKEEPRLGVTGGQASSGAWVGRERKRERDRERERERKRKKETRKG